MSGFKSILYVTVNRSDYGIWRPLLRHLSASEYLVQHLFITGAHHAPQFGNSREEIREDGFCNAYIDSPVDYKGDSALDCASVSSRICLDLAKHLSRNHYDAVAILGDRFEMLAAALAVVPFRIPLLHFHGGCITEGAIDDSIRHAITKLAHFHFVETEAFRRRLMQMGEHSSAIRVTGPPSLAILRNREFRERHEFLEKMGMRPEDKFILITLHTETTKDRAYNAMLAKNVFDCVMGRAERILVTAPSPDPFHEQILSTIKEMSDLAPEKIIFHQHLGHENYFDAMRHSEFLVGNSSSGIIEAASLKKFVLNVGDRQKNRLCDESVFHCKNEKTEIIRLLGDIDEARSENPDAYFIKSVYGDGRAPQIFEDFLIQSDLGYEAKVFVDSK